LSRMTDNSRMDRIQQELKKKRDTHKRVTVREESEKCNKEGFEWGSQSFADFLSAPNRRSDVILKIGEKRLHVSKEILAIQSPVLETLFFGDFA
ncbi:hypothetical protein PMAYCL1PPCAC_25512, partial [Pristionchus mayeri]